MTAGLILGRRSRGTEVDLAMGLAVLAGCTLLLIRTSFTGLPATSTVLTVVNKPVRSDVTVRTPWAKHTSRRISTATIC